MQTITLDAELRGKMNGLTKPLEILDESGNVLGHYLPDKEYRRLLYAAVEKACPLDQHEIARRRQEKGGSSLAEFWKTHGGS